MPDTPRGYPYPIGTDPNDVPADMQALADAVDTDVQDHVDGTDPHPVYETSTEATTRMNTHVAAGHPTVPLHDAEVHRFVGAKAVLVANKMYTSAAPPNQTIPFDGDEYDTDGIHATAGPGVTKLVLPFTGYWRISFRLRAAADAGGATLKNFRLRANGTTMILNLPNEEPWWLTPGDSIVFPGEVFHFVAGDYVEILHDPSGAGGTSVTLTGTSNCQFAAEYRGA